MALHKPSGNGSIGGTFQHSLLTGTWLQPFPTLWEFLTLSVWPDGSRRELGTILLFVDGASLKACLKDKNGPRTCFLTAPDPDTLLLSVEEGLAQNTLDWRPDKPQQSRR